MSNAVPKFYDRYSNVMLSYNFIREQMVNLQLNPNQTLSQLENKMKFEQLNIENAFHLKSMEDQNTLNELKVNHPTIIETLVGYIKDIDSVNFCNITARYTQS